MAIRQVLGILLILISLCVTQQEVVAYPLQKEMGQQVEEDQFSKEKEEEKNRKASINVLKTKSQSDQQKEKMASMENGKIIYGPVKDTTASTVTTWRTEGFTVKSKKTYGDPTKGRRGEFWLKDGEVKSWQEDGETSTIFTFPENKVTKQLQNAGINAQTLKESGGYVYLNAIIQVYENGKPTGEYYRTLEGIKHARGWNNLDDFDDRFDIEIQYAPAKQKVTLIFKALVNGTYMDLGKEDQGAYPTHSFFATSGTNIPMKKSSLDGSEQYYLYEVYYKNIGISKSVVGREKVSVSPLNDYSAYCAELPRIRKRSIEIQDGGLEVYAIYKKFQKEVETDEEIEGRFEEPISKAIIQAEERGNEKYDVEEGIPVTKNLYLNGFTNEYLLKYRFYKVSGTKYYPVKVTRTYHLTWTEQLIDKKTGVITYIPKNVEKTVTKTYSVKRKFQYWKVDYLHGYRVKNMILKNDAFPVEEDIEATNVSNASEVGLIFNASNVSIKEPKVKNKMLPLVTISGGTSRPVIPVEDWSSYAEKQVGTIQVRNDKVTFKGKVYMGDDWCEGKTEKPKALPTVTKRVGKDVLYKEGVQIPVKKANGSYESEGTVFYQSILHVGAGSEGNTLHYPVEDVNGIVVHTPVICQATISDDRKYNQLKNPNAVIPSLILDREFQTDIATSGEHQSIKGYGQREYREFVAKKQVKFPFDVYRGKEWYPAGTWIDNESNITYYLPTWVQEGVYSIQYRCISLNGMYHKGEQYCQEYANFQMENYTATDTKTVQVVGRVYGFSIRDISDYPLWQSVFRKKDSMEPSGKFYSVGVYNRDGNLNGQDSIYTLPLFEKSHPNKKGAGIMKPGYQIRFTIDTIGTMATNEDYIRIQPKFYYMNKDGSERREVAVYYSETVDGQKWNFIKMGGAKDITNKKSYKVSEPYFSVTEKEQKRVCDYLNLTLQQWRNWEKPIYTYQNIMLPDSVRTFIGEIRRGNPSRSEKDIGKSVQRWYGQYGIPSEVYVAEQGVDIKQYAKEHGISSESDIWLKDGYLVLQFQIETIQNKAIHLDYCNKENEKRGFCNMWKVEGYCYGKENEAGEKVLFEDGDVLVYDLKHSAARDYKVGGTH